MGKYRNQYDRNKQSYYSQVKQLKRVRSSSAYAPNDYSVMLNEAHNKMYLNYINNQLDMLEPSLIKEMEDEIVQFVMKNIDISFKNDSLQFSKTIASDISTALKSIGMK